MSWGFLMGAGKGLQGAASSYGRIMDEKRKNDFQLQRDELAFERQKSLADLQNQYAKEAATTAHGRQLERDENAEKFQLGRDKASRDFTREGWDKEMDMYKDKKSIDAQYQQQVLEQSYNFQKLKTDEERKATAAQLKSAFEEDGEMSTFEKMIVLGAETGTNVAQYFQKKDGSSMSAEMVNVISDVAMGNKDMQKLAEKDPAAFFQRVKQIGDMVMNRGEGGSPASGQPLQDIPADKLASVKKQYDALPEEQKPRFLAMLTPDSRAKLEAVPSTPSTSPVPEDTKNSKSSFSTENMTPGARKVIENIKSGWSAWEAAKSSPIQ